MFIESLFEKKKKNSLRTTWKKCQVKKLATEFKVAFFSKVEKVSSRDLDEL